jgi:hypothetical protein
MQIASCALALVSCTRDGNASRKDPESIRLEGRRVELEHKVAIAQLKADRVARQTSQDTTPVESLPGLMARRSELSSRKVELEAEIRSLEDGLLLARATQLEKARSLMLGKELPRLQSRAGRVYEQVKIVSIDDSGVQIRHASGSARLGCSELSESQWEQFGLDEGLAKAARLAEDRQRLAYEEGIDRELAATRKPTPSVMPTAPIAAAPQYDRPKPTSAFDRRVSLGSSETYSDRTVARYRTQRRTTIYYYPYNPTPPSCYSPIPRTRNTPSWSSGLPANPQLYTNP